MSPERAIKRGIHPVQIMHAFGLTAEELREILYRMAGVELTGHVAVGGFAFWRQRLCASLGAL